MAEWTQDKHTWRLANLLKGKGFVHTRERVMEFPPNGKAKLHVENNGTSERVYFSGLNDVDLPDSQLIFSQSELPKLFDYEYFAEQLQKAGVNKISEAAECWERFRKFRDIDIEGVRVDAAKKACQVDFDRETGAVIVGEGSLTKYALKDLDKSLITSVTFVGPVIAPQDCSELFVSDYRLEVIRNLEMLDTSQVTNMYQMFAGCSSLRSLDVSSFDTSKVTNMSHMFEGSSFTHLDLSNFDTRNVTNMAEMFSCCTHLESLDASSFDLCSVTNTYDMFWNCPADVQWSEAAAEACTCHNDNLLDEQIVLISPNASRAIDELFTSKDSGSPAIEAAARAAKTMQDGRGLAPAKPQQGKLGR